MSEEYDNETAAWLEAVSSAFPDFDFSGCYDQDDLRTHLVGQAETQRGRVAELEAEVEALERTLDDIRHGDDL